MPLHGGKVVILIPIHIPEPRTRTVVKAQRHRLLHLADTTVHAPSDAEQGAFLLKAGFGKTIIHQVKSCVVRCLGQKAKERVDSLGMGLHARRSRTRSCVQSAKNHRRLPPTPQFLAAQAQAQKDWPTFVQAFREKAGTEFAVKGQIIESTSPEDLWLAVDTIDETQIHGRLDN